MTLLTRIVSGVWEVTVWLGRCLMGIGTSLRGKPLKNSGVTYIASLRLSHRTTGFVSVPSTGDLQSLSLLDCGRSLTGTSFLTAGFTEEAPSFVLTRSTAGTVRLTRV